MITNPGTGSHDALVLRAYDRVKQDLSDEAKLRIANFILFVHEMDISGRGDDFQHISVYRDDRHEIERRRIGPSEVMPQDGS